jgi:selenide, water dikinase
MPENEKIRLTQFSHGAGCGCKIAPGVLREVIASAKQQKVFSSLLVGNESSDDAAVYDIGNGTALISTVDFFMPIVDDAYDFGRIAAANSVSDVFAMGGKPILAIAVLGWPVEKLPLELCGRVMEGGSHICDLLNIPLAGGHTIDSPEPFFGLCVNGIVGLSDIKRNNTAKAGDIIYLSKPLGTGILTTAHKRGIGTDTDLSMAVKAMTHLNSAGEALGKIKGVNSMTDITGFGLLGHLLEVCEGSKVSAQINMSKVPLLPGVDELAKKFVYPDNTFRNWKAYDGKVLGVDSFSLLILCDPQTSGGLMVSVSPGAAKEVEKILLDKAMGCWKIGEVVPKGDKPITVLP